jgi:penicillin-binding protein 1A
MKWLGKLIRPLIILVLAGGVLGAGALLGVYLYIVPNLPDTEELRTVQLQVPLRIYAKNGELIAEYGEKRRSPLNYADIPEKLIQAFISAEDDSFFTHPGVDLSGLVRAGIKLILTGERRQGGSTITMQVARNFYLTRDKTYLRKLYEIFLALRIEQELSKSEILELYLNKIYLGQRAYGVGAAAQVYYGRKLDELNLAEIAMIAGLPKAPSRYNPLANAERAVIRRNYVLGRMLELGFIDEPAHEQAVTAPVTAKRYMLDIAVEAPYVAEMVRAEMLERFDQDAYTGGYRVYTTVRKTSQTAANQALRKALDAYTERHGYRGTDIQIDLETTPEEQLAALQQQSKVANLIPALVTQVEEKSAQLLLHDGSTTTLSWPGISWARPYKTLNRRGSKPKTADEVLQPGHVIRVRQAYDKDKEPYWRLAQIPEVAGALVSLDTQSGAIMALVGGYDFYNSKFNRATQAIRQPGSGIKPFVYSAALEKGFTPASIINDAPVVFNDRGLESAWRPQNYSGKFYGPTRLREALAKSRNLVSVRLLSSVGINYAIQHINKFGFDTDNMPRNLSLALGNASVTPIQMARGFAVLANGGFLVEPYVIERIEQNAEVIDETQPKVVCAECETEPATDEDTTTDEPYAPRVLSAQNRYLIYSMMQDVIKYGTATRARQLGRNDLAGKTGTTNDQRDAWFNGFNQSVVASVWVGFDNNAKLGRGEVGGRAALPAWMDYMRVALDGTDDAPPQPPAGIVSVRIDPETGLRATADTPNVMFETFREEYLPEINTTPSSLIFGGSNGGATSPAESLF